MNYSSRNVSFFLSVGTEENVVLSFSSSRNYTAFGSYVRNKFDMHMRVTLSGRIRGGRGGMGGGGGGVHARAHCGFVIIYLLSEGYVIPVCVRVIQIFTVTERVSG